MTINTIITKIKNVAKEWEEELEPQASEPELIVFSEKVLSQYSISLPIEYLDFLRIINGLEFNGLILYGTNNSTIDPDGSPLDLLEMNEILKDSFKKLLGVIVIGEDSTGLITYDSTLKQFQYRDRIGIDRIETFHSFKDMLETEINKVL